MFDWYWVFAFYIFLFHVKACVLSLYMHRTIIHSSIEIDSKLEAVFKFFAWTVMAYYKNYKQMFRAQHSKHHDTADTENDPHSPHYLTFKQMFDIHHNEIGRPYYVSPKDIEKYAKNLTTEEKWVDKNIYLKFQKQGYWFWFPVIALLYGPIGLLISIPILSFVITECYIFFGIYCFHKFGYYVKGGNRNSDQSKNFLPWGIIFCGEELHSNHHRYPGTPKFSKRWFEFDIGWMYIRILMFFGLVKLKHPKLIN